MECVAVPGLAVVVIAVLPYVMSMLTSCLPPDENIVLALSCGQVFFLVVFLAGAVGISKIGET